MRCLTCQFVELPPDTFFCNACNASVKVMCRDGRVACHCKRCGFWPMQPKEFARYFPEKAEIITAEDALFVRFMLTSGCIRCKPYEMRSRAAEVFKVSFAKQDAPIR